MSAITLFEEKQVRRAWNQTAEKWYFAIVDVISILTESVDAGAYWRKLKERLKKEGNETVTNCHGLKMTAADGKQRITDVADTEQLLRPIQSIPSPKADPFKLWFAKVKSEGPTLQKLGYPCGGPFHSPVLQRGRRVSFCMLKPFHSPVNLLISDLVSRYRRNEWSAFTGRKSMGGPDGQPIRSFGFARARGFFSCGVGISNN